MRPSREADPVKEIARWLAAGNVSALPVLDEDRRVVGVVSEADLLLRAGQREGRRITDVVDPRVNRDTEAKDSCTSCGDLTVEGPATYGFSAPWPYGSVDFSGTVQIAGNTYAFKGPLVYS